MAMVIVHRIIAHRIIVAALVAGITATAAATAHAYSVEPGSIWLGASVAPRLRLHSPAGGAAAFLALGAQGEYAFDAHWAAAADLNVGLAGTVATRFAIGPRYRLGGRGSAISPFGQMQFVAGRFYHIGGINLGYWGVHLAAGADYFATARLRVGSSLGLGLGATMGRRDGPHDTLEWLVHAAYRL